MQILKYFSTFIQLGSSDALSHLKDISLSTTLETISLIMKRLWIISYLSEMVPAVISPVWQQTQ